VDPERAPSAESSPADLDAPVFALHRGGKIEVRPTVSVNDRRTLSLAYTPGVAEVCLAIAAEPDLVDDFTWRQNVVAVITDGSAVLGLGDIGAAAGLPVMEGKALLFKNFAGLDAVPILLDTHDVDRIVDTVAAIAPSFGGINLEDISAPRCFEIERRLQELLDIPVFHDDQHGTAIVVLAALTNAAQVVGRPIESLRVVIVGAGAAGIAISDILLEAGVHDLTVVDSVGIIEPSRSLTPVKADLAARTNPAGRRGGLDLAMAGADVFIGVSSASVPEELVATMATDAIIFALANPTPEIAPDIARRHAAVVATGRSDYPNQINNVLAFPGVFKGALSARATRITPGMTRAAAVAIAGVVGEDLSPDCIIPSVFDEQVAHAVSKAVAKAAVADGVVRPARAALPR
jgi:malate dehydrogenase (oxaloacetate-decarboxylating)